VFGGAVFSGKKHNVFVRDFLLAISCMGGIFFLCEEGLWEFLFVSRVVIDPRIFWCAG
jgi:hypothetical protein